MLTAWRIKYSFYLGRWPDISAYATPTLNTNKEGFKQVKVLYPPSLAADAWENWPPKRFALESKELPGGLWRKLANRKACR